MSFRKGLAHALEAGDEKEWKKVFRSMSTTKVLEMLGEIWKNGEDFDRNEGVIEWWAWLDLHERLGDEGRAWGIKTAKRLLERKKKKQEFSDRLGGIAFLALVRAGVPIEAEWDSLLTVERGLRCKMALECLRALPPERRDGALVAALQKITPWDALSVSLEVLKKMPLAGAARFALDNADKSVHITKRSVIDAVQQAAKKSPEIAALVGKAKSKRINLLRGKSRKPKRVDDLSPIERKQLVAAGKRYDGESLTAAERLAPFRDGNGSFRGFLEIVPVLDAKKKPLYDAFLYMVDSGTIFHAGTTRVAAEIVQSGIQCKNAAVAEAIEAALAR